VPHAPGKMIGGAHPVDAAQDSRTAVVCRSRERRGGGLFLLRSYSRGAAPADRATRHLWCLLLRQYGDNGRNEPTYLVAPFIAILGEK
jgi:hypothetical protein